MTSRILGVVREQVLAAIFGAGNAMDAYIELFSDGAGHAGTVRERCERCSVGVAGGQNPEKAEGEVGGGHGC